MLAICVTHTRDTSLETAVKILHFDTIRNALLSPLTRLPSGAGCSAGETGERGRGADTDVYAAHTVFPLQLQHTLQQSEATYHPISIIPAAGKAT